MDRVEFDPFKAAANFRKHGIRFPDAVAVLSDPQARTIEDPDAFGEPRYVTLGRDALGRLLVVVYSQRAGRTRVISARKASRGECEAYHA